MWQKMSDLSLGAYIAVTTAITNFVEKLKSDEDGMEMVQVILILALGVFLIAALYTPLTNFIKETWAQITDEASNVEPFTVP